MNEGFNFFKGGRQSDEVKARTADESAPVSGRVHPQSSSIESRDDEGVDGIASCGLQFVQRGCRRIRDGLKSPMLPAFLDINDFLSRNPRNAFARIRRAEPDPF